MKKTLSPLAVATIFAFSGSTWAGLYFDPSMIADGSGQIADLKRFETDGSQLPGAYPVDIYVNGNKVTTRTVRFVTAGLADKKDKQGKSVILDDTGLLACLDTKELADFGVNVAAVAGLATLPQGQCISPGIVIPYAYTAFNFQKMRLDLSFPQSVMKHLPRGWIPPEQWDEGINALLFSWRFNGSENHGSYGNSRTQSLNLTSGANLGSWRLRDNSYWVNSESAASHKQQWQHLDTYLQHAIIPWRSELTLGDSASGSDVFDSLSFRGVQLATDDSMYPDTARGFAPTIKGTANSNAQVVIRQRGNVIYRTAVAPGYFEINDLFPISSGGDLNVTVIESDGTTHSFVVPYSSVPVLQRKGHFRYETVAGRYRNSSSSYAAPAFTQGTLLWGLPHSMTAYGGVQLSDKYRAAALGVGLNMGLFGAISGDITYAKSQLADGTQHTGQSLRFLYGRSLVATGTTFQLAGYRFSTQGFHTLDETALTGMSGWTSTTQEVDSAGRPLKQNWANYYNLYSNKRDRFQANITQNFGMLGAIYLIGSRQTYWDKQSATTSWQAGFSSTIGKIDYSLSYGYSRYASQMRADRTLYLSLSLPFSALLPDNGLADTQSAWARYSMNKDGDGHLTQQTALSGTMLAGNNLNWSVSQGYGRRDGNSGDASLGIRGTYGNASVGYGYSSHYRQIRYDVSGSAIVHRNGLTLGQPLGTTNILIAAPGASGIPLENGTGVRTDWRGYTVLPYANMYRENRIVLDMDHVGNDTDIENAIDRVVPTRGALVRANFIAHLGLRALIELTRDGKPLPFGAVVTTERGSSGLVGEQGEVYLSGLKDAGEFRVQWGDGVDQKCTAHYALRHNVNPTPLIRTTAICR